MYPLEFQEFAKAVGVSEEVIRTINECFIKRIPVDSFIHSKMMDVLVKASRESFMDGDSFDMASKMLQEDLIYDILVECKTIQVATNVLVDICYADNKSKDLLWELCAEQMIKNLIANGYDKLRFPIKDEDGDIIFKGIKFRMEEVDANGINWK